jgi:hypothetical protein
VDTYLPLLTAALSFFTALAVATIGVRTSKSVESSTGRYAYLNYALQKLMDEYVKYDPVIYFSDAHTKNSVRLRVHPGSYLFMTDLSEHHPD